MKNILLPIFAFLTLTLCSFNDAHAADVDQQPESDNLEVLVNNIENPTTAFLSLDENPIADYTNTATAANDELANQIIDYASKYLGRPYRRGGKGPSGFDCSGFTSYIFKNFDISLSPSSRDQFTQGERISLDEVRPGDLLFFSGRAGGKTVGHVAMAIDVDADGKVKFIHAANRGGIRHDTYPDGGYYSKRYLGARRVLNN